MRLVYIGLGWSAGIILTAKFIALSQLIWVGLALMLLVIVGLTWKDTNYRWFNIALLAFALGGLRYSFVPQSSNIALMNNTSGLTIEGVVVAEPDIRDDRTQIIVAVDQANQGGRVYRMSGRVLVYVPRVADVSYGDKVAATGLLYTPAEYDTFSYADYLARSGVFSIMDRARLEVVEQDTGNPFYAALYDLRGRTETAITRMLPEPQAGLLIGILLGYERNISPALGDDFSKVGASHVIAISGFNMVIIAGIVMGLLEKVLRNKKWLAAFIGLSVMGIYTVFAGANAAVLRAALMSAVLIIGQTMGRKTYVPTTLAFVAILMSFHNPLVLWDLSFQLSFFATLGLALFVEPLEKRFTWLLFKVLPFTIARRVGDFLSEPLIVTLAATLTTLPLIILYFQRLSIVSIIVNLLIIPAQTYLLIIGGLATMIVVVAPPIAQVLFWIDYLLLSWTIGVVRIFARLPFADAAFAVDSRLVISYFVVLIGWAIMVATQPTWWLRFGRFVRKQAVITALVFSGLALFALMVLINRSRPDGQLHVWFLDVGHSNAVLIETPNGAQMLVDGGRYPSRLLTQIGDHMPFVDREIELMVITQPDEFDVGALPAVLKRYDVGVTLTNGQPNLSEAYIQLEDELLEHDMLIVKAGYTIELDDGVLVEVLHPSDEPTLGDNVDDYGLVLRVSYQDVSFLLTSDLSREGQISLLEAGEWPLATVMQLPQHGTARSLDHDFLGAVQPQAIVIQTDKANRRGDPDANILEMLPENASIWRTDVGGMIHMWTDGSSLWGEQ